MVGHYTTWRQTVLSREGGYSTMQHFWLSPLWVSLLKCSRRLSFQRRHAEIRIHGGTKTTGPCGPYRQLPSLPGIKRDNYPYVLQPGHGYGRQRIPSPRGRVHCQKRTVENVIRGFDPGPQSTERKARADKTSEADKRALIAIVTDEPQLFLSEIAGELRY